MDAICITNMHMKSLRKINFRPAPAVSTIWASKNEHQL